MYKCNVAVRVRYSETDQMGYVYYGNYAQYFEVARVEMLKGLGISYKSMEDGGIMLPVLSFNIKYYQPAFYDDLLNIETSIDEMPRSRIAFRYKTYNASGDLLNEAATTLVFVTTDTKKPCRIPDEVAAKLAPYFK